MKDLNCRCSQDLAERITSLEWRERIAIFVDNNSLFKAIHKQGGKRIDYVKMRDYLIDGRTLHSLKFYYTEPPLPKREDVSAEEYEMALDAIEKRKKFYFVLEKNGYSLNQVPQRQVQIPRNGAFLRNLQRLEETGVIDDIANEVFVDDLKDPIILEVLKTLEEKRIITKIVKETVSDAENEPLVFEKGLDSEIIYDMVALSRDGNYDTFVLVAGEEDYARAVAKLSRDKAINIEVAFFPPPYCSFKLHDAATEFIDISKNPNLFRELRGERNVGSIKEERREYCHQ
jgi:uncharacterized LabA/DUF88 family protein